jgi:flagellar biosynthesis protein FliP
MKMSKFLTVAAMASLAAAPVVAQASEALPTRTASSQDGEAIAGVSTVIIVLGLLALAGIIILIADDGNNKPASP